MKDVFAFALVNFPILSLVAALIWSLALWVMGKENIGEISTRRLLLLAVGLGGLWGFSFHALFPNLAAEYFDWPFSTFESRMGVADLAFGVCGILAFWQDYDFCLAVSIIGFCFYPGLFLDHIFEIFYYRNLSPGNIDFLTSFDLILPVLLAFSLYSWNHVRRRKT